MPGIPEASEISQYECPTLNPSHVILDALYALGKTEDDFDWVQKPVILRMSTEIVDACYEFLRSRRKPRSVNELYIRFVTKGYLLFTDEELLKALLEDSRFVVEAMQGSSRRSGSPARHAREENDLTPSPGKAPSRS